MHVIFVPLRQCRPRRSSRIAAHRTLKVRRISNLSQELLSSWLSISCAPCSPITTHAQKVLVVERTHVSFSPFSLYWRCTALIESKKRQEVDIFLCKLQHCCSILLYRCATHTAHCKTSAGKLRVFLDLPTKTHKNDPCSRERWGSCGLMVDQSVMLSHVGGDVLMTYWNWQMFSLLNYQNITNEDTFD